MFPSKQNDGLTACSGTLMKPAPSSEVPTEPGQARWTRSAQSTARNGYVEPTAISRAASASPTPLNAIAHPSAKGRQPALLITASSWTDARRKARGAHGLVVDVPSTVGVAADAAEADAEGLATMSHHVSEPTLKSFAELPRSRARCWPHNNARCP